MKLIRAVLRSVDGYQLSCTRCISFTTNTNTTPGSRTEGENNNTVELADAFEQRILGPTKDNDTIFQKLKKMEQSRGRVNFTEGGFGSGSQFLDGLDESFTTLSDGMDGKLKKKANYFQFDPDEIASGDYTYRPDVTFYPGMTYETKELDLTQPEARRPFQSEEFEVTTEEVLKRADFRNVRFLANFLTDAGIIIKRSQTRISAKAQRKVAREIKTARAFGLMPFTTMGQDRFDFGRSRDPADMEDGDENYGGPLRFVEDEPVADDPVVDDPVVEDANPI